MCDDHGTGTNKLSGAQVTPRKERINMSENIKCHFTWNP